MIQQRAAKRREKSQKKTKSQRGRRDTNFDLQIQTNKHTRCPTSACTIHHLAIFQCTTLCWPSLFSTFEHPPTALVPPGSALLPLDPATVPFNPAKRTTTSIVIYCCKMLQECQFDTMLISIHRYYIHIYITITHSKEKSLQHVADSSAC